MSYKRVAVPVVLSGICCVLLMAFLPIPPSCKEILENTIASVEKIETLKFHLKCNERIKNKLVSTESQIKLNTAPRKIYIYLKGPELLWVAGKNNGNALVNPAGFPYMNINLDPMGSLMRENQHHTINEIGFSYFASIIKHSMQMTGNKFEDYFKCGGSIMWDEHDCYFITAEYPDFTFTEYTVQKGETLITIAHKLNVSDYMLLEINSPKVGSYRDVKTNQKIKIPNVYGKKMILYIDKELFIPRVIKVYDDKGLFESYEYHELQLNPKIAAEEFTREYKGYRF
jgi:Protein of unknown function (DUF1571)/LysM domain